MYFPLFQIAPLLLCSGLALAQEDAGNPNDQIRRLRFRRPRPNPKVVGISDEEGVAQGRPIPLRQGKTFTCLRTSPRRSCSVMHGCWGYLAS